MIKSLNELRTVFTDYLEAERFREAPKELYEPNNYILHLGGKRLRPILVLLGCELMGDQTEKALPAALSVEYFHNYTLIHDDIMDQARLRRGREAVHIRYGLNAAILSGDVLLIYAYHYLNKYPDQLLKQLLGILNRTAIEVCEGQSMDLSFESRDSVEESEYLEMIRLKTSVLLAAALKIGALVGGASAETADKLYEYGVNLGLAFQIQDDLLDTYGDDQVGKVIGGDIRQNKKTILLIRALECESDAGSGELAGLLEASGITSTEKIAAVKAIYEKHAVLEYVTAKRDAYVATALNALETIDCPQTPLRSLVDALVKRDF